MKVFVVLVLAVFTGCQANLLYADEPKPQVGQLTFAFWDYVAKAKHTAEDTLKSISESQLGQDVSVRISEGAHVANQYATSLQKELSPRVQNILNKILNEAEVLRERHKQDLTTVKDKLQSYAEDLRIQILSRLEELKVAVAPYAESFDSEALKTTVLQETKEHRRHLKENLKELYSQLEPYAEVISEKVQPYLQEFWNDLEPLAERLEKILNGQKTYAQALERSLTPYARYLFDHLLQLYFVLADTD
ncbi:apolipoprotein Eb-like [Neoarius graeffei]|uniref:apolipoprotein Eb-like n=1 Tax=Neoarius graeffei TaxID=443677 RepID=UPI00298C5E06|nr:apolipoprotein Eb-like [Neoarius graeffei]